MTCPTRPDRHRLQPKETPMTRTLAFLLFSAFALVPLSPVWAQVIPPPSTWHPYRGGTNCIQVADSQGRFNCAAGTTVDPATGNMVVGGTLAFQGLVAGTFSNGLILAEGNSGAQVLNAGELVIATPPKTVATSGP